MLKSSTVPFTRNTIELENQVFQKSKSKVCIIADVCWL